MQISLKEHMDEILLNGLQLMWEHRTSIKKKWWSIQKYDFFQLDDNHFYENLLLHLESTLLLKQYSSITAFFTQLQAIPNNVTTFQANQYILTLTLLENMVHKITQSTIQSKYQEYQAIHYVFSKINQTFLLSYNDDRKTNEQIRVSDLTIQQLISALQSNTVSVTDSNHLHRNSYESDAVLLFNKWIIRSTNFSEAVENIASGFVHYLPFKRCALFSHEKEKGIGLIGYHVKDIDKIEEELVNIPSVLQNSRNLINLQPIYIAHAAEQFPKEYVKKFQLESLVMVPLFVASKNKLLGIAILDCGERNYFELTHELLVTLMRFGQCAAEIVEAHSDGKTHPSQLELQKRLTTRELEVLRLMADGLSIAEAAENLHLSTYTVRDYVSSIIKKLGAKNRTHAAVIAAAKGIISI